MSFLSQAPPLEGLSPSHGAFQEHAAHNVVWSTLLSSKGSSGTCIPDGLSTFLHAAFTAHRAGVPTPRRRVVIRRWGARAPHCRNGTLSAPLSADRSARLRQAAPASAGLPGHSVGENGGPAPTPPAQAAPRGPAGTGRQAAATACGPRPARGLHRPRVVPPRWSTTVPRLGRT